MTAEYDRDVVQATALAEQLATLMPGWHAAPRDNLEYGWPRLVRDTDGAAILVHWGGWHNAGRVTFRPTWPRYADGTGYRTPDRYRAIEWRPGGSGWTRGWSHPQDDNASKWDITCSQKRSPEALAREIARRLLPAYEVMYEVAVAEVAATNGHTEEAGVIAQRLAGIMGVHARGHVGAPWREPRSGETVTVYVPDSSIYRMKIVPAHESVSRQQACGVDLEIHGMSPETAAKVLVLLQEREERRSEERARVAADFGQPRVSEVELEELDDQEEEGPRLRVNGR